MKLMRADVAVTLGVCVVLLAGCSASSKGLPVVEDGADTSDGNGDDGQGNSGGTSEPGGGRPVAVRCTPPEILKDLGGPCGCHDECESGSCVDGVCCSGACEGTCQACNIPGKMGSCSPIPAGMSPVVGGQCKRDDVSTCGLDGTCDGSGACRRYPDGTSCAKGMCDGATVKGAKACRGGKCETGSNTICTPFGCEDEKAQCFAKCERDDQCAAGERCEGGSCGKKPLGAQCMADPECDSGFCADGVCCNTGCKGGCVSCDQPDKMGECSPVARDQPDKHGVCKDEGVSTCGTSGVCDGRGGCAKYAAGTICRPQMCEGANQVSPSTCDGMGACKMGAQVPCPPYGCVGNACVNICTNNSQCASGNVCINGSCGQRGLGQKCGGNSECRSNFCVDGVCCESGCNGQCRFCASPQAPGRCINVPAGEGDPRLAAGVSDPARVCAPESKESCGRNGMCNGNGGCQLYDSATECSAQSCASTTNTLSLVRLCNGFGACRPQSAQTCSPYKCNGTACGNACGSDNDCVSPNQCIGGRCGLKPAGALCGNNNECGSNFCRQGVCCQTDCRGSCFSCAQQGSRGQCTAVPAGAQDPAGTCKNDGVSSCDRDGACDGSGKCRLYAAGQVCAPASCTNGGAVGTSTCDGTGNCVQGSPRQCGAFKCNAAGTACYESCTDNNQCVTGRFCVGNACGKKANGGQCAGGEECESGNCSQGFCCDQKCDGLCKSCSLAGSQGKCSNIKAGEADLQGRCTQAAPSTCGNNGSCDGSGACAKYDTATTCRDQSCPSGSSTATQRASCDGKGACPAVMTTSCGTFQCDPQSGSCLVGCANSDQCVSPNVCSMMSCGLKAAGASCQGGSECQTGKCVDGVCCSGLSQDQTSCGACRTCNPPGGTPGTCQARPVGFADGACAPAPGQDATCGTPGVCTAGGQCASFATQGTPCGSSMCVEGNKVQTSACNGSGTCAVAKTETCPGNRTCEAGVCRTSCNNNNQCVGGKVCQGGECKDPKKANGDACTSSDECASASCADGVCCNSSCGGPCVACNLAASKGTCTPLPATTPESLCMASSTNNQCNYGVCGEGGACLEQTCVSTCSDGALTGSVCNGTNTCMPSVGSAPCQGNFTCENATKCRSACSTDLHCQAGFYCQSSMCIAKRAVGEECTNDSQCGGAGICAQGVCCNSACSGTCQSCSLTGSKGTCSNVPAGGTDPSASCQASAQASCGDDGTCNGSGACRKWTAVKCGTTCSADSMGTQDLLCDGAGNCATAGDVMACAAGVSCVAGPPAACMSAVMMGDGDGKPGKGGGGGKKP